MKIVIVGGGIAGLVAYWAFSRTKAQVKILEPGQPGAEFLAGGLKYLNRTEPMVELLNDLALVFSNHAVNGGILLRGEVHPYPFSLRNMPPDEARTIQHAHYRKTRRTEPDRLAEKSMNDPDNNGSVRSLKTDLPTFVRELALRASRRGDLIKDAAEVITHDSVRGFSGAHYPFDAAIVTLPLWISRKVVPWLDVPFAGALKLNVVQVNPLKDPYARWDYVYTPYTPDDLVHRFSPRASGYNVEFNGIWDDAVTNALLTNELNFLFPHGWALDSITKGLNGHLLPLEREVNWKENVQPLGRFAQWDPRATTDVVLKTALDLAKQWTSS
jgi:FAD dependent oxidoreductase